MRAYWEELEDKLKEYGERVEQRNGQGYRAGDYEREDGGRDSEDDGEGTKVSSFIRIRSCPCEIQAGWQLTLMRETHCQTAP